VFPGEDFVTPGGGKPCSRRKKIFLPEEEKLLPGGRKSSSRRKKSFLPEEENPPPGGRKVKTDIRKLSPVSVFWVRV